MEEKIKITPKVFWGNMLSNQVTAPEVDKDDDRMLSFVSGLGASRQFLDMSIHQCSKHVLMIGGIGTGKTNTFNLIIDDLESGLKKDDVMLIFDTKGDFYSMFFDERGDCVIGNSSQFLHNSLYWNIFREIEYGGVVRSEKILMAKEIAKVLFENRKNSTQPFFSSAATDLFAKVLIGLIRRELWDIPEYIQLEKQIEINREDDAAVRLQRKLFEEHVSVLNNKYLVEKIFHQWQGNDYLKLLDSYEEFKSAKTYIGDGTSNQALGVFGELNSMINDYFIGVFADYAPGRDASMRELIHNKGGRKIFVEYDLSIGEVLSPVYTLLIDLGLKEALGRNRSDGNTFLVIDEFKLLPKLSHIDDALNFGRSLGIKVFAGIQSIKQLEDIYGEARGMVIASGFSNIFAFRMTDEASRRYVSNLFGKNYLSLGYYGDDGSPKNIEREGYTVEDWNLLDLGIGQAIIGVSGYSPFRFQFSEYKK